MLDTTLPTIPPPIADRWDASRIGGALATAQHHAARHARRGRLHPMDREDLRQDALLALLVRSGGYDPAQGAWSTFADLVVRHALADRATAGRAASTTIVLGLDLDGLAAAAGDDPTPGIVVRLDLLRLWPALPPRLQHVLALVAQEGSLAEASRMSGLPTAAFYRAVADLRLWLRAAGLAPREKDRGVDR